MTLEEITRLVKSCAEQMNARYKRVVFDEWVVVSLAQKQNRILSYFGPRNDDFLKNFTNDLGALREELLIASSASVILSSLEMASARCSRRSWCWERGFT